MERAASRRSLNTMWPEAPDDAAQFGRRSSAIGRRKAEVSEDRRPTTAN
jgi:hypothetical protein